MNDVDNIVDIRDRIWRSVSNDISDFNKSKIWANVWSKGWNSYYINDIGEAYRNVDDEIKETLNI